jgi:hypothetical protein
LICLTIRYASKIDETKKTTPTEAERAAIQKDIDKLQANAEKVIEKAIPTLQAGSEDTKSMVVGNSVSSTLITSTSTSSTKGAEEAAVSNGVAYADMTECLQKIRTELKLPATVKLTVATITRDAALNLSNIEKGTTNGSTVKTIVYRSDTNAQVDTSICANSNVQVKAPIKGKSALNMNRYRTLKDEVGMDTLNPNDPAFNDRCYTYSDKQAHVDTTINTRRKYYFQGMSVQCSVQGGQCDYSEVNANDYVDCNCTNADPKNDITSSIVPLTLPVVPSINIDIVKCVGASIVNTYITHLAS